LSPRTGVVTRPKTVALLPVKLPQQRTHSV
jgi:hypothetical protein